MPVSLILAALWALAATVIGLIPARSHWPAAIVLIVLGIPIVIFVFLQAGPLWALGVMAGMASVLRWPLYYLGLWLRRLFGRA